MKKIISLQSQIAALQEKIDVELLKEKARQEKAEKSAWVLKGEKWAFDIPNENDIAVKWDHTEKKCVLVSGTLPEQIPVCFKSYVNEFVRFNGYTRPDKNAMVYIKKS